MDSRMEIIVYIIAFIFVLGVMILIHELGHFLAARYFNVKVDAFSFGFGPRLFGFKRGDTDYKVCLLPLGGFVKMAGENPGEPPTDARDFMAKPRWQRMIIAVMGPVFNFALAIVLLIGLFMVHYEKYAFLDEPARVAFVAKDSGAERAGILPGDVVQAIDGNPTPTWESVKLVEITAVHLTIQVTIDRAGRQMTVPVEVAADEVNGVGEAGWSIPSRVVLGDTLAGLPAEKAGILPGDILASINGEKIVSPKQVQDRVRSIAGRPAQLEVLRDGQTKVFEITPVFHESEENGGAWLIGVQMSSDFDVIRTHLSFGDATQKSLQQFKAHATLIFSFLQGLIEGRMSAKSIEGPLGIARHAGRAAQAGWPQLIMFMALISVNLGVLNLLPIPILDGGVITMLLLESFIRRDISIAVKERIVQVGFVFLMLLIVFVMYNDILKL